MVKPNRCNECHKRLGIMEYKCRCGYLFCISHLQAEKHKCTYDYKEEGKNKLRSDNIAIISDKLIRI